MLGSCYNNGDIYMNYKDTLYKKFVIAKQTDGTFAAWCPILSSGCEYGLVRKIGFCVDDRINFFVDCTGHPSRIISKIESMKTAKAAIDKYIETHGSDRDAYGATLNSYT